MQRSRGRGDQVFGKGRGCSVVREEKVIKITAKFLVIILRSTGSH